MKYKIIETKKLEFSKEQLIEAFRKWNADYLSNPEYFGDIKEPLPEEQAETLIDYLKP